MAVIINIPIPNRCGDCPCCIYTADEKNYIGYCNTSDDDYYCKVLDRFMEYDKVDGGVDILGKPSDCPLKSADENTVSEKVYTDEFNARKEAEFELYKLRRNIDEMIAEIKGYCDEFGWYDGDLSDLSDAFLSIIHQYCDKGEQR